MGISPIISPVLDINFRARIDAPLEGTQALVFTSANGVRAWGPRRPERDLPVFAVGDSTADAAREIGFRTVHSARGNVDALAELVARRLRPGDGDLLHVRGIHVAGDLNGALKPHGFRVRDAIGYGAVAVDTLSEEAIAVIVSGAPVRALVHSARGAKTFLDLLRKFGLHHWLGSVRVFGISPNALKPLHGAGFAELIAAPEPNEAALLGLLEHGSELARASNAS